MEWNEENEYFLHHDAIFATQLNTQRPNNRLNYKQIYSEAY